MKRKTMLKRRYLIFLMGLVLTAFGVAIVTKGVLGTSPIAAIPYSLSLVVPIFSMGTWVVLFNVLLVAIQWLILRKEANRIELLLQVVMSFIFGYGVDFWMLVIHNVDPKVYGTKLLCLLIGSAILAFGAYLEVIADVVMLPGDGFVRACTTLVNKEFGTVRVMSDIGMSVIAAIICFVGLHRLAGVREGTIIAALLVGNLVKFYVRSLKKLSAFMIPKDK